MPNSHHPATGGCQATRPISHRYNLNQQFALPHASRARILHVLRASESDQSSCEEDVVVEAIASVIPTAEAIEVYADALLHL